MTVVFPEGVPAEGNVKVLFLSALADINDPTLAELNAGIDLSCYLLGTFSLGGEQATGTDRRLCSKETFQTLGRVARSVSPLTYVYDPQAAPGAEDNEAYETLEENTQGYLAVRYGLDAIDVALAATQKVDIAPVTCGFQSKDAIPEDDEFAKLTVTQTLVVTGPVAVDVPIAAS